MEGCLKMGWELRFLNLANNAEMIPGTPCYACGLSVNSSYSEPFFFAPPSSSDVPCDTSGFAGLMSSGFSSLSSPAFCLAPSGLVMFGSKAASSFFAAVSSVPDFAYSFASVFIFSRSCWASRCGFSLPPSVDRCPKGIEVVNGLGCTMLCSLGAVKGRIARERWMNALGAMARCIY